MPKLTIVAPFVAFIILHNEPLQPFLSMSDNWHPRPAVEKLALARFDIFYLGLVIVGIAVALYSLFCPSQVTTAGGYAGFIEFKERTKTDNGVGGSLRLTLEEFARYSKRTELDFDARERRHRFPRRFREGLWNLLGAVSLTVRPGADPASHGDGNDPRSLLRGLLAAGPERSAAWDTLRDALPSHSIDVFRLEYIRADYSAPATRSVVFWLLLLGLFIALVPTAITTYLVVFDLFRVLSEAPVPE